MIAIRSRRAVIEDRTVDATVVVDRGRIADVVERPPPGVPLVDGGDQALLPGLVDCHVHVNEPGRTEWEGFETATRAALAGGITTLVDMPLNCVPVTTNVAALALKVEACRPLLSVDCGFWGGVVPGNTLDLQPLVRAGALGAKAFMCHSGIDDFPASDVEVLRAAMIALAAVGAPLLVHAELELPVADPGEPAGEPATAYASFLHSRPPEWEVAAVAQIVALCRETGCRVHVVHLSAAAALPALARARAEGLPITVETCPHYLCLSAEEVPDGATEFKCCPPIRESANRDALWQGLRDRTIDIVVSDHSPCTPDLKLPERGDFLAAWGGIASLQLGLSAVWTEASRRGFDLADLVGWMSTAPARMTGLYPWKGVIRIGAQADLVLFDPSPRWDVDPAGLHHRHPVTPYRRRSLLGRVTRVWLRGEEGPLRGRPLLGASPGG